MPFDTHTPSSAVSEIIANYSHTLKFYINGSPVVLDANTVDPEATLLDFIRTQRGLTGTKLGCGEGGCGACTVVYQVKQDGNVRHLAVNACLAPLASVDGKHIITVEGIGSTANPHPLQERMARLHSSQCGIVMSIYATLRNAAYERGYNLTADHVELEGALDGNLCRCTGYKPILDAAKSFVGEYVTKLGGKHEDYIVPVNVEAAHLIEGPRDGEHDGQKDLSGCPACHGRNDAPPDDPVHGMTSSTNPSTNVVHPVKSTAGNDDDSTLASNIKDSTFGQPSFNRGGEGCGRPNCCRLQATSSAPLPPLPSFPQFDFKPYRPGTELIYPPALSKHILQPLAFGNDKRLWIRPTTVDQIIAIKQVYPFAKIVGGSSEVQVEVKFKGAPYDVCIYVGDVAELSRCTLPSPRRPTLVFGANFPLAELERVCGEVYSVLGAENASALEAIRHQLRYFAGRQIRNVASAAGNVATASPISDLNPVLVATATRVVVRAASTNGGKEFAMQMHDNFFVGYRKTTLPADAVIVRFEVPVGEDLAEGEREVVRSYKQAKRKDDDIAIVTAGMYVKADADGKVIAARLVYGGMAPFTVIAKEASSFLVGKCITDPGTLQGTLDALARQFQLPYDVPGGMPTYRCTLTLSFFYRYYHELLVALGLRIPGLSNTEIEELTTEIHRGVSSGSRDNSDPYAQDIVGRQIPHLSGLKHTTGEAVYTDDMPRVGNEGYGALVISDKAHARLVSVDPSAALEMPGVLAWVDHRDVASPAANWWGHAHDEEFFKSEFVTAHGQPIGLVVADTKINAQAAARLVKVEYEILPALLTIEEAIEAGSFFDYDRRMKKGKPIETAFAEAEFVFEGTSRMGGQEHFYLETQGCLIVPKLEDGEMEVFSSTQALNATQDFVAQATGVPRNRIVARGKRMGGGFGGKETRSIQLAGIVAVAAKKLRRPIRCILDRDMDMMTSGQRHPFLTRWKVGCTKEGKVTALQCDLFCNGGYSLDLSIGVSDRALAHIDNCYHILNVDARARVCKTNTVSNTAFRGFGGPQGMFTAESYITLVAEKLGLNINLYKEGEKTHYLQVVEDWHVPRLLSDIRKECDYDHRRKEVDAWNVAHKWRKRGLAMVPTKFGMAFGLPHLNQAGALVHIYTDGSILVAHGGTEMGQGLYTKMIQVAAQELKVPLDTVFTSESSTSTVPNTSPTAASSGTDLNGMAVKNACEELNRRLAPYREKLGADAPMTKLAQAAYMDRVSLSATGHYLVPKIGYEWGNFVNPKPIFFYYTQGVAVVEVEVDCLTGDHTILRTDLKMDVGRSINPAIDYGQVEGAFIQGYGLFTMEESLWLSHNGQLFTRGPGAYKIPGFSDVPQDFRVSLLRDAEWPHLGTIASSKGVGEPPLFLGATVLFAMRDALRSARVQANLMDVQDFRAPLTAERIRLACGDVLVRHGEVKLEGKKSFFAYI
ncbi:hypothetical protein EW146_g7346 [Bondarzewia mesenterica]|uniref:Xanthine dehydrogenase n=1 Tax=Bondarzewia mesenterica TaxID=1095465 RepID=A0A4S4LMV4_9AGAM|nr:hypothetical protein EW146_g7346 [Bondarzewia mesenterica]